MVELSISTLVWDITTIYKNRLSNAENGGYPPTQNGDIRLLF